MATEPVRTQPTFKFGDNFELNLRAYELRRAGQLVKLEPTPFELLVFLIEQRGNLVGRQQIVERIWGKGVFLDTDNSINGAIRKIRQVLIDDPENPCFIQTVTGKGYRFIAPAVESEETRGLHILELPPRQPAAEVPATVYRTNFKRTLVLSLFIVIIVGAVGLWITSALSRSKGVAAVPIRSIAVLPLQNLSGDSSQEYLADGMTEELIGRLSGIHDLRVISRTSVMHFKNTQLSVPEIAKTLEVDAIVEGSVMREGSRIRVHAQLIRGATDEHFWSQTYERNLQDVLALQSDVAEAIAEKVEVSVTGKERARLVANRQVSPEAYENNLKGSFVLDYRSNSRANIEQSILYFQDAIASDPSFAQPYVGLGDAYNLLSSTAFGGNPAEMHTKAMRATQKALELDPELADAHLAYAEVRQKQYQWAEAEAEFKRAIELGPNNPDAHFKYAEFLGLQGRVDEAMAQAQRAGELNPPVGKEVGSWYLLIIVHRYDEALSSYRDQLALGTDEAQTLFNMGTVLLAKHQAEQAVPVLEKAVSISHRSPGIVGELVMAYAQAGRRRDALRLLAELQNGERPGYSGAFVIAYLGLGDYDKAFTWLERGYQEQANIIQFLKVHPFFDPIRGDPRFQDLLRGVGLN